jgi:hypothetical protein
VFFLLEGAGSVKYLLNPSLGDLFHEKYAFHLISPKYDHNEHDACSSGVILASGPSSAAICEVIVPIAYAISWSVNSITLMWDLKSWQLCLHLHFNSKANESSLFFAENL